MNARGFVSPYVLKDGRCTSCTELFNTVSDSSIDHIYITTDTTERVVYAKVGAGSIAAWSLHNSLWH